MYKLSAGAPKTLQFVFQAANWTDLHGADCNDLGMNGYGVAAVASLTTLALP